MEYLCDKGHASPIAIQDIHGDHFCYRCYYGLSLWAGSPYQSNAWVPARLVAEVSAS